MANNYITQHQNDPEKVAALIYFKEGVDVARVQAYVDALAAKGVTEGAVVRPYVEAFGAPVWYIP